MQKTLADLLKEESQRFNNFCYSSFPYSCGIEEASVYAKDYVYPKNATITRDEKSTLISIPPKKGSRKRKPFIITLWIS